jgi:diacylglycerol kinase family enzyme
MNNDNKIVFFLNPGAGNGIEGNLEDKIQRRSKASGYESRIYKMKGQDDEGPMRELLESFHPIIAVACGGDGTVNLVARLAMDKNIKLGIIPLGSANGMAYQMNIPTDPIEALSLVFTGEPRKVDVIKLGGQKYCLHLSDLGMNARVIRRFEREKVRGFLGYAKQYFKELGNISKFKAVINTGDGKVKSFAIMVIIANSSYYGTGATINPEGNIDDGKFEIIVIKPFPFWFFFYLIIALFTGGLSHHRFIRVLQIQKAAISVSPSQELQVDGEIIGREGTIDLEVLPGKLEIIGG